MANLPALLDNAYDVEKFFGGLMDRLLNFAEFAEDLKNKKAYDEWYDSLDAHERSIEDSRIINRSRVL